VDDGCTNEANKNFAFIKFENEFQIYRVFYHERQHVHLWSAAVEKWKKKLTTIRLLFRETANAWINNNGTSRGAALAYYAIFSVGPLLLITLAVAGFFWGKDAAEHQTWITLQEFFGSKAAQAIADVVHAQPASSHIFTTLFGMLSLLIAATGVFTELQDALNAIWHVRAPKGQGLWLFFRQRFLSFILVLGTSLVLLLSLLLTTVLASVGHRVEKTALPGGKFFWQSFNYFISFAVITLLFALILKFLPRIEIQWREAWKGALLAALLFNFGKFWLGLYFEKVQIGSAFGAAGSLIIVLIWVYYSAQIFYFGAEFSRACTDLKRRLEQQQRL